MTISLSSRAGALDAMTDSSPLISIKQSPGKPLGFRDSVTTQAFKISRGSSLPGPYINLTNVKLIAILAGS